MFTHRSPAAAYAQVGVEVVFDGADPHRLILMLFDGAMLCVAKAQVHMEQGQIAEKGQNISQAINIIANGLRVSLDMEAGGDLAEKLASLYDYMVVRLLHANMHNQLPPLAEVSKLLAELKEAWEQIAPSADQGVAMADAA